MDSVTHLLVDRSREFDRFAPMITLSLIVHAAIIGLLVAVPASWRAARTEEPRAVMTISLGGAPGPRAGGMTPMGGRPVQSLAPLPDARPQPVRPPAAATPEMTVPDRTARRAAPKETVKAAPDDARGRTPTRGAEEQPGSAVAETGARGLGFGLTTGGGGTGGYLEVGNFCCPEYLTTMISLIQRNWNSRQQVAGDVLIRFEILRDGRLTGVQLEQSSGYAALDLTAQRAMLLTKQFPPLPGAFPDDHLTVHLRFQYQR